MKKYWLSVAAKGFLLVLAVLLFQGCASGPRAETAKIPIIELRPVATEQGVLLQPVETETIAYKEVIERSPNVKSVTRVTENEDYELTIDAPVMSPTEDVLVYAEMPRGKVVKDPYYDARETAQSNIYKQTIGAPGKTRVTYGMRTDSFPAFTPDGRNLVFSSNRTGPNPTLWQVSLTGGGGIMKITNTLAQDYAPCVSPDETFIAYTSNPPGAEEPQIWKVNPNGLLPTQLREGEMPGVSPDGSRILFIREDKESKQRQLWVMSMDGTGETQLTNNTDFEVKDARWSPDGQRIVYTSNEGLDSRKRHNYDIWMMNADGTNKTQLTTNGSWDDWPCWDYKGQYIYFRSNRGAEAWNIWRFEPVVP